jgi:hypothetical protein
MYDPSSLFLLDLPVVAGAFDSSVTFFLKFGLIVKGQYFSSHDVPLKPSSQIHFPSRQVPTLLQESGQAEI